jgi:U3 small nucleolar RNA-associated protein 14
MYRSIGGSVNRGRAIRLGEDCIRQITIKWRSLKMASNQLAVEDLIKQLESEDAVSSAKTSALKKQARHETVKVMGKKARTRLDRQLGYEQTKDEVTKWEGAVRKNRGKLDLTQELPES